MAVLTDAIQVLDDVDPYLTRSLDPVNDEIVVSPKWTFNDDVTINANLVVTGDTFQNEVVNSSYEDNHLFLNAGYTTTVAQTGGLVVNYLPEALNDTVNGTFTAGVASTSNPTVITTGTGTFSAGQLIQISGAADPANNGVYEVLSHVGTTLTIRGIGTTATVEDFTDTQFVTDATAQGTITHANFGVFRIGTDGVPEFASGNTTGFSFTDVGTGGTQTLNDVYVNGNTATTSAAEGNFTIAGTEALVVTASGGVDIDTQFDFDGTVFDVQMTGTNGFSIDGTAASNVSVDSGNLTLSTTTSGDVVASAAGVLDLDGNTVDMDSVAGTALTAGTAMDIDAGTALTLDGATTAALTAGSGNVTVSSTSAAAQMTGQTGATVTATTGTAQLTSVAGEVDITASTLVDINGATLEADLTGGFSIDAADTSNISVAAAGAADDLTIEVTGSTDSSLVLRSEGTGADALQLTATAGGMDFNLAPNRSDALVIADGADTFLTVETTNGAKKLIFDEFSEYNAGTGAGVVIETDDGLAEGDIVYIKPTTGHVGLADANAGTLREGLGFLVSTGTFSASADAALHSVPGTLVPVRFASAPAAAANGRPVFVSNTAGLGQITPPAGSGAVIFQVGILQGADGADTTPLVLLQPRYVSRRP